MTDDKKSFARAIFGWAVDFGDKDQNEAAAAEPAPAPAEELAKLPAIDPAKVSAPKDGSVDAGEIFDLAGIPKDAVEHVNKAQDLLRNLPAETPVAVKRQIVEASLKAFGFDPKHLIETSIQEIRALEAYIRAGQGATAKVVAATQAKIEGLQAEIAKLQAEIERSNQEQVERGRGCTAAKLEVQKVLEFFGAEQVAQVAQGGAKPGAPA